MIFLYEMCPIVFTTNLRGRHDYAHFTDTEMEVVRVKVHYLQGKHCSFLVPRAQVCWGNNPVVGIYFAMEIFFLVLFWNQQPHFSKDGYICDKPWLGASGVTESSKLNARSLMQSHHTSVIFSPGVSCARGPRRGRPSGFCLRCGVHAPAVHHLLQIVSTVEQPLDVPHTHGHLCCFLCSCRPQYPFHICHLLKKKRKIQWHLFKYGKEDIFFQAIVIGVETTAQSCREERGRATGLNSQYSTGKWELLAKGAGQGHG